MYPDKSFTDSNDEFKEKLFKRYCKDPSGNIIKRVLTTDYLGKFYYITDDITDDADNIINENYLDQYLEKGTTFQ